MGIGLLVKKGLGYGLLPNLKNIKFSKIIILILIIGLLKAFLIRIPSPFPYQPALDQFNHMLIINKILKENIFHISLKKYSSVFLKNAYTTLFHILISISIFLTVANPLHFFWVSPFFMIPLFAVEIYLLTFKITKNKFVGFLSSIISIGIIEFSRVPNIWHFLPSIIVMTLVPIYLDYFYGEKINPNTAKLWFLLSLNMILLSYFTGLIFSFFFLFYLTLNRLVKRGLFLRYISLSLIVILLIVISNILKIDNYSFDWFEYENFDYMLNVDKKTDFLIETSSFIIFVPVIFFILFYTFSEDQKHQNLIILFLISVLLYYLPISFTVRAIQFFHTLISIFSAIGFYLLLKNSENSKLRFSLITLFVVISISSFFIINLNYFELWKNWGDYNFSTSFLDYEYEMGEWVRKSIPKKSLIISDPTTQAIINGISMRETLNGQYMSNSNQILVKNFIKNESDIEINLTQKKKFLIFSGRTAFWVNNNVSIIYGPKNMENMEVENLIEDPKLELLHQIDDSIYAFQIIEN
jgi:hypothetical protein